MSGGLFERAAALCEVIQRIDRVPSDEESEGLLRLLPPTSRNAMGVFFAPHVRPAGLAFLKLVARWLFAARDARAQGKKILLVPFNFPPELVLAFDGAVVLTSEVLSTLAALVLEGGGERYWEQAMAFGLPDHVCSANTIEIGSLLAGEDLRPDAIISAAPGACDANAKIHELAAEVLGVPQLMLEQPVDDTEEGRAQFARYFRQLIVDLEQLLGERLDDQRLRRLLAGANRCTELYWQLFDLRRLRPSPVPAIFSLMLTGARFCAWGTEAAERLLQTMVAVAREHVARRSYPLAAERARVLWAYTSYYFDLAGMHGWMERRGYAFLADLLDLSLPRPVDLSTRETMVDGLIEAAWTYPMNRQMARPSMSAAWVEDMLHVCRELGADCAVYCGHDACKQTWSVVSILREELARRAGIPLLVLHGDSWLRTTTPISAIQEELDTFVQTAVLGGAAKGGEGADPRRRAVRRRRRR